MNMADLPRSHSHLSVPLYPKTVKHGQSPASQLPLTGSIAGLSDLSNEESTNMHTPSPLTKLKQELLCQCGSTVFVEFRGKFNCKQCGVLAIKSPEGYVFVSSLTSGSDSQIVGSQPQGGYLSTRPPAGSPRTP